MTKTILTLALALTAVVATAQEKFSPEKFRAELESFIVKEACLSPQEASAFFPLYDEMQKKQRVVFGSMRRLDHAPACSEAECKSLIKERDKLEIELKKIQQTYHNKFLAVLSARKVFNVLKAEDNFHRHMLRKSDRKRK